MFQTIGAFLDALLLIGFGLAGRFYGPRWVSKDGTPEEVARRIARTRTLSTLLMVIGGAALVVRLLST